MSRHATDWLGENLAEITKTSMPNGRGLGQDGMVLLFYFCDRANKESVFYMQVRTIMDETGLSMTAVKRLMTQFEQLGWITRTGQEVRYMGRGKPTPEYALTLVNENAQNILTGAQKGAQLGTSTDVKPNNGKAFTVSDDLELEPQPQLEPQPGDLGKGGEFDELLRKCIEWELANYPGKAGTGLLRTWRNEYTPIVTRALQDRPTEDLVLWSVELRTPGRTGYQRKPNQPAPLTHLDRPSDFEYPPMDERGRGAPGCPTCGGKGWYLHRENGRLGKSDCTCTTDTTTERVSADLGTNTPVMECPAPADTRSELRGVLQDMTSKYRMPADPY